MTSKSHSNGEIKYSPIVDTSKSDFSSDLRSMEAGLPPVEDGVEFSSDSKIQLNGKKHTSSNGALNNASTRRSRTLSVDEVTQAGNGQVVTLPSLHIPGESGELADMSDEMKQSDELSITMVAPEKLKKVYAQVSGGNNCV